MAIEQEAAADGKGERNVSATSLRCEDPQERVPPPRTSPHYSSPSNAVTPSPPYSRSSSMRQAPLLPPPPYYHHPQPQELPQQTVVRYCRRDGMTGYPVYGSPTTGSTSSPTERLFPATTAKERVKSSGCTCKKSCCLKLYCQCFASSTTCGPNCKCRTCRNTPAHSEALQKARRAILERNPGAFEKFGGSSLFPTTTPVWNHPPSSVLSSLPSREATRKVRRVHQYGCKCRRSFCLKKYCECFLHESYCGLSCRCLNCRNTPNQGKLQPTTTTTPEPTTTTPELTKSETDSMTIMAAVAMTELFGSAFSSPPTREDVMSSDVGSSEQPEVVTTTTIATTNTTPRTVKRRIDTCGSEEELVALPLKKRKPVAPDEQVRPAISLDSVASAESRNPSPVLTVTRMPSYTPSTRLPPTISRPSPPHLAPPHHGPRIFSSMVHGSPYGPPGSFEARPLPPLHPFHRHPHVQQPHYRHHPPTQRASPPHYQQHQQHHPPAAAHLHHHNQHRASPPPPTYVGPSGVVVPPYQDLVRGLPKSLSFRKICSKCGKTRGEHGELGFGNKCVYQDCGKCGARIQMHLKKNQPMGILCRLTVADGATAGAAAVYERKIRDLAVRAELQKELARRKQHNSAERSVELPA